MKSINIKYFLLALIFFLSTNNYAENMDTETTIIDTREGSSFRGDNMNINKASQRIIGFLPGWKIPPDVSAIQHAGYTHIIVAFAVFSLSKPGEVVPVFDNISKEYIKSLKNLGVKVLVSLGGASTSLSDTTVNFHQVLSLASSQDEFRENFVNSIEKLIDAYGFDGVDFDIENGLIGEGSFTNPTGDIASLAGSINLLHARDSSIMITLTPQIANIAATSGFDAVWGNYASLIMQTHDSLEWVGIQIYNSGCAFGINLVCYDPNDTNSPDAPVAFAVDLLESWPRKDNNGRETGFQPYISYLKPSQVVLGFAAPNANGVSDGSPPAVVATIKRAVQCLRSGRQALDSCDTYVPPRIYNDIGGVFEWEIIYDENNNYKFAIDLISCVVDGNCQ